MPDEPNILGKDRGLQVDPLYLTALASLGMSVPAKLVAPPANASIAVLPFLSMGGDSEQEYFTDGLTEDIITDLSNAPGFFVIARNSTFAYKGKPMDVRQIAHDLGVKFILEGSARRSDKRLRVNVQLIDAAEGGNHVWAERFDRELADIFTVQDEITRRVVEAISGKLAKSPIFERYRTSNLEAYDLCLRVRNHYFRSKTAAKEAQPALERAIELDPRFAEAHCELALVHLFLWLHYGGDKSIHQKVALVHAKKAVELDPNDSLTRAALGFVLMHDKQWTEAGREFQRSVEINSNDAEALAALADYKMRIGECRDGLDYIYRAVRLNPRAPAYYYWTLGDIQIELGNFDDAVKALNRPEIRHSVARRVLASALALSGRKQEAEEEAAAYKVDYPDWTIAKWSENDACLDPASLNAVIRGYRLAGLPE